jgi:hypothetical protein
VKGKCANHLATELFETWFFKVLAIYFRGMSVSLYITLLGKTKGTTLLFHTKYIVWVMRINIDNNDDADNNLT